jgi:hypothetical protein
LFSSLIRLILEGYIEFCICSLLNTLAFFDNTLNVNSNRFQ